MRISVDPETNSEGFGYAPPGTYRLRVVNADTREGPKAAYISWQFEFVDPNVKATDPNLKLGAVYENTTLKKGGNAQFRLKQLFDAIGHVWGDFEPEELHGREFDADVDVDEYEGKFKNIVKRYLPLK